MLAATSIGIKTNAILAFIPFISLYLLIETFIFASYPSFKIPTLFISLCNLEMKFYPLDCGEQYRPAFFW